MTKEMGFSVIEFERALSRIIDENALTIESTGQAVIQTNTGGRLHVSYQQQSPRRIAGLEIPVLKVTLIFEGFGNTDSEDGILTRFNHATQRGGG